MFDLDVTPQLPGAIGMGCRRGCLWAEADAPALIREHLMPAQDISMLCHESIDFDGKCRLIQFLPDGVRFDTTGYGYHGDAEGQYRYSETFPSYCKSASRCMYKASGETRHNVLLCKPSLIHHREPI
jgi:hypothetical protein